MLAILSNLNLVTRIEISSSAMDSLLQGSWIDASGAVGGAGVGQDLAPGSAFQVWTESDRAKEKTFEAAHATASRTQASVAASVATLGTPHFSPDAVDTGALTVLYGKYRAATNMYCGTIAIGNTLFVNASGMLEADVTPSGVFTPFAVCTKAEATYNHIGSDYSVIEYVTV